MNTRLAGRASNPGHDKRLVFSRVGDGVVADSTGLKNAAAANRLSQSRILVVDDEEPNVHVLKRILSGAGFEHVMASSDPLQAIPLFLEFHPDLVLLDLHMKGMDGFQIMEQLRPLIPEQSYLPILVLTGDASVASKQRALTMGAKDFLAKPFDITEVVLRIHNLLETRFLHLLLADQNQVLEARVVERTRALNESQIEMLQRLAAAAEVRDDETGQHTQRVGELAGRLARALNLPPDQVELIRRAAPLHDVGKIGVPDGILLKPGRLTETEFALMKTHTTIGARILTDGRSELLQVAERIAMSHHERWDGNGYPERLAGTAIPLEARLVGVADFFDALTHERPYRSALAFDEVVAMIQAGSGSHFDPAVAGVFVDTVSNPSDLYQPQLPAGQ